MTNTNLRSRPLRAVSRAAAAAILAALALPVSGEADRESESDVFDPHGDPRTGVERVVTRPSTRGQCVQCHDLDARDAANPHGLFVPSERNDACFAPGSPNACHLAPSPGYPAAEGDRVPDGRPGAGYFEVYIGGERAAGLEFRKRWPGAEVYEDGRVLAGERWVSPHYSDPDMPRRGEAGEGLCLNCHDPHGTESRFDLLRGTYGPIGGWETPGPPPAYDHCLGCHGRDAGPGMSEENRRIEDYYDEGLQGDGTAGHRIRLSKKSALTWPGHVRRGDRLPCYDCHNPHGSRGNDGVRPNAYLISDERPGWSGLTDPAHDPDQSRRFCLGCHIPSDGVPGSNTVGGIVMNAIPSTVPEHAGTAAAGCFECHGGDYSTPTSHNVHHPRLSRGMG